MPQIAEDALRECRIKSRGQRILDQVPLAEWPQYFERWWSLGIDMRSEDWLRDMVVNQVRDLSRPLHSIAFETQNGPANYETTSTTSEMSFDSMKAEVCHDDIESHRSYDDVEASTRYDDMEVYSYEALPPGPYIRVLRSQQLCTNGLLTFTLKTIKLQDAAGKFDALSYTWGPKEPTHKILVNGKILAIRSNLFAFLNKVYLQTVLQYDLWADAICIDQENNLEKSHQVRQMQDIFQESRTTRVWLGDAPFNYGPNLSIKLDVVLRNTYWTRLWIIQEVILSTNIVIHFSDRAISWAQLITLCKEANSEGSSQGSFGISMLMSLHRQRRQAVRIQSFSALLKLYGNCSCSDPRDRVFGLLGISSDQPIKVDYDLTGLEIFERVANRCAGLFACEFFAPLWDSLDLRMTDEMCKTHNERVVARIQDCGSIVVTDSGHAWSTWPVDRLICYCFPGFSVDDGDDLFSFWKVPQRANKQSERLLVILRRSPNETNIPSVDSKARYDLIGLAISYRQSYSRRDAQPSGELLRSASAYRIRSSAGFGPMLISLTVGDFCLLRKYLDKDETHVPYDGFTGPDAKLESDPRPPPPPIVDAGIPQSVTDREPEEHDEDYIEKKELKHEMRALLLA